MENGAAEMENPEMEDSAASGRRDSEEDSSAFEAAALKLVDCKYCGAEFESDSSRDGHVKEKHAGASGFMKCGLCGAVSVSRKAISNHMDVIHGGASLKDSPPVPIMEPFDPSILKAADLVQPDSQGGTTMDAKEFMTGSKAALSRIKEEKSGKSSAEDEEDAANSKQVDKKQENKMKAATRDQNSILSRLADQASGVFTEPEKTKKRNPQRNTTDESDDQSPADSNLRPAEDSIKCNECGRSVGSNNALAKHMEDKHLATSGYRCPLCGTTCRSTNSLHSHMSRTHRGIPSNQVPLQSMPCDFDAALASRLLGKFGIDADASELARTCKDGSFKPKLCMKPGSFSCPVCGKVFNDEFEKKKHVKTQHRRDKLNKLNKPFVSKGSVDRFVSPSVASYFKRTLPGGKPGKIFAPLAKRQKFDSVGSRRGSSTSEAEEADNTCKVCGKNFLYYPALRNHMVMKHKIRDARGVAGGNPKAGPKKQSFLDRRRTGKSPPGKLGKNMSSEYAQQDRAQFVMLKCAVCAQVKKNKNSMATHMSLQHRGISMKDKPPIPMGGGGDGERPAGAQWSNRKTTTRQLKIKRNSSNNDDDDDDRDSDAAEKETNAAPAQSTRVVARKSTSRQTIKKSPSEEEEPESITGDKDDGEEADGNNEGGGGGGDGEEDDDDKDASAYQCAVCGTVTGSKSTMTMHMTGKHQGYSVHAWPPLAINVSSNIVVKKLLPGDKPKVGRPRNDSARPRIKSENRSGESGFKCAVCGGMAGTKKSMASHMSVKHRGISMRDQPPIPLGGDDDDWEEQEEERSMRGRPVGSLQSSRPGNDAATGAEEGRFQCAVCRGSIGTRHSIASHMSTKHRGISIRERPPIQLGGGHRDGGGGGGARGGRDGDGGRGGRNGGGGRGGGGDDSGEEDQSEDEQNENDEQGGGEEEDVKGGGSGQVRLGNKMVAAETIKTDDGQYECTHCDKVFVNTNLLANHFARKHEETPRRKLLKKFKGKKLRKGGGGGDDSEAVKCGVCGKAASTRKSMATHMSINHRGVSMRDKPPIPIGGGGAGGGGGGVGGRGRRGSGPSDPDY